MTARPVCAELAIASARRVVAGLDDGVIVVGPERGIVWANEAALRMHGVRAQEELGGTLAGYRARFEMHPVRHPPASHAPGNPAPANPAPESQAPESQAPASPAPGDHGSGEHAPVDHAPGDHGAGDHAPLERVGRGEAFSHLTVTVQRPGNAPRATWRVRALALGGEPEAEGCLALLLRDLSGEVDAEERFEDTFAANPAPAVICRLSDLRFIKVNEGFLEMTGHARDAVLGRSVYELDVLEEAAHRDTAIAHLQRGETIRQQEACLRTGDGSRKLVIVAGHPIMMSLPGSHPGLLPGDPPGRGGPSGGRAGEVACMLFTFVDLEPRRRAEIALRHSEARFAAAFELAPVPMLVVALDGLRILSVNAAFTEATGWSGDEAVRRSTAELKLWGGGDAQHSVERQARQTGSLRGVDVPLRAKGGALSDVLLSAETVTIQGQACVLCVMQDIAERRRTETELMEAIEAVMQDGPWLGQRIVEKLARLTQPGREGATGAETDDLSAREREVLGLMAQGLDDAQVAHALGISRNTVRNHVSKVYRKIGVKRRGAAVVWARERGLATPGRAKPGAGRTIPARPARD